MRALLDISDNLRPTAAAEIGHDVGQLLTPTNYAVWSGGYEFGIDNGGFNGVDVTTFERLLAKAEPHRARCLFVACPDVVYSGRRTIEVFARWRSRLAGWPVALVAQNGIEDLDIPWEQIAAVFIGGDDGFKDSRFGGHAVARCAKVLGKHVHVGRINGPARWLAYEALGADTADGTGLAKFTHMREAIRDRNQEPTDSQLPMFGGEAAA